MQPYLKIIAATIPASSILLISILIFFCLYRRKNHRNKQQQFITAESSSPAPAAGQDTALQSAIAKLHLSHKSASLKFHQLTPQPPQPPSFAWDHHPRLVSEAAENGWARFVFASVQSSVSKSSSPLFNLCAVCEADTDRENAGETNWETPAGSSEYMQTVRINPAKNNSPLRVSDESLSCTSVRMSSPLPGPNLIGCPFPQEAYFEVTVLYIMSQVSRASKRSKGGDDDRAKLIEESSESDEYGVQIKKTLQFQENSNNHNKQKNSLMSLGFTQGGSGFGKLMPGAYPGSIGFQSNGCVYLDGMKLVSESERTNYASVNRVIGCGFNPSKKKVFFTLDSELVHVIRCNSDAYKNPLYPILSSNCDVMVLVNLGQTAFKYAPANVHRTPNPSFLRSSPSINNGGSVIGYEDSRELFSMERIDSQWLEENKKSKSKNSSCSSVVVDIDGESDLFEISLHK